MFLRGLLLILISDFHYPSRASSTPNTRSEAHTPLLNKWRDHWVASTAESFPPTVGNLWVRAKNWLQLFKSKCQNHDNNDWSDQSLSPLPQAVQQATG